MSRPVQRDFTCECGQAFTAAVYRSANVAQDPALRAAIFEERFNVVECPGCGRQAYAEAPFLYHDPDAGLAVWVYPTREAHREAEIRAKLRRAREILTSSLGEGLRGEAGGDEELVFGLARLAVVIAGRRGIEGS